ncbi:hypothetical protein MCAG_03902 [Micromonospora sp. ATCC 39149]|uniref:Uncharacterized protein n=1 Tax=Micromonospora carbonacea TaxID=47853 RepID=A0A7D5YE62_9ACTN|nr:hypothetical protein [Micromonospora sp. ATCC 39149]EEP73575.1 hypothetical protein MCAG_03902 [Micromonospora sp. ATCC 39149]QLJ99497.1 hypothetical protein HZU44_05045 [Micromonospora carbonacea]
MYRIGRRLLSAGVLVMLAGVVAVSPAVPAHAVPSMTFVTATSAINSDLGKTQLVHCPPGRRILGGGAYVGGGGREVMVDTMKPVSTPTGDYFQVNASVTTRPDHTGFGGDWFVVAYGICGSAPAGLEYVSASTARSLTSSRSVTVSCPAGKRVIGAGGQIHPAFGFVVLDDIVPSASLTSVRVAAYEAETTWPIPWGVEAFAVCADPIPGLTLVSAASPGDSLDKTVGVTCPTGTRVHGLGASLTAPVGEAAIIALYPAQPLDHVRLEAREDRSGYDGNWTARVHAICAT